jgi:putative oxidoreductase
MMKSLAHMLLGAVFITGGVGVLRSPDSRVAKVEHVGIPRAREATILNATIMIVAGSALAMDVAPKLAALTLIGSLIPTTWAGHRFWEVEDPVARIGQQNHFFKNLAIIGGLLAVLMEKDDE